MQYLNMDKFFTVSRTETIPTEKKDIEKASIEKCSNGGQLSLKFVDKNYLEQFKNFLVKRIKNFDPIIENDKFDVMLINIWHSYIFSNVDSSDYYKFVKVLNENIDEV